MRSAGKVPGQGGRLWRLWRKVGTLALRLFRLWTYRDLEIPEGKPVSKDQRWEGLQMWVEGKLFDSCLLEGMAGYKFGSTQETYLLPENQK